jgi:indole-3-glycerol phosphate synthase
MLPILRKDFTIDEVQVYEARAIGADAILLICTAIPDDALLTDLHGLALDLGMSVLVEAHDAEEVARAARLGARVIGVNSRDLATFNEDLAGARALAAAIPAESVAIAESSIRSVDDARAMARAGFDAVLVGEALVRADDPVTLLREFASAPVTRRT